MAKTLDASGDALVPTPTMSPIQPFLKWAGGKRWFVANHRDLLPSLFENYIEPFLGSGAVFFHLAPTNAILSDANKELIDTYSALKLEPQRVLEHLRQHQRKHNNDYYYWVRDVFRPQVISSRAARFLYLNRTCWNGLFRVNKQGVFNVPRGTKDTVLLSTDDFQAVSARLRQATLIHADFEEVINRAGDGDFLFVDPPYTVRHNVNGFLKYNQKIFSWEDQVRLRDALVRADGRGARFALTNAFHKSVLELYDDFNQVALNRHSVLSGSPDSRGKTEELFVTNYKWGRE